MATDVILVKYETDLKQFKKDQQEFEKRLGKVETTAKKGGKAVEEQGKKITKTFGGIGSQLSKLIPILAAAFAVGRIIRFGKELLKTATQMEQFERRAAVVFGNAIDIVEEFAQKNARALGFSINQFKGAAAAIGDILVPLGLSRKAAAEMSVEAVKLGTAIKRFSGDQRDAAEISSIVARAFTGEVEGLKGLGVVVSQNSEDFKELVKTKIRDEGATQDQAKALAIYETVLARSADALTALETDTDSLVVKQDLLNAKWSEASERLATRLIPTFNSLLDVGIDLLDITEVLNKEYKEQDESILRLEQVTSDYNKQLSAESKSLKILFEQLKDDNTPRTIKEGLINQINTEYGKYLPNLLDENSSLEQIGATQKIVNDNLRESVGLKILDREITASRIKFEQEEFELISTLSTALGKSRAEVIQFAEQFKATTDQVTDSQEELRLATEEETEAFVNQKDEFLKALPDYIEIQGELINTGDAFARLATINQRLQIDTFDLKAIIDSLTLTFDENTKSIEDNEDAIKELLAANKKFREQVFKDIEKAENDIANLRIENEEDELQRQILGFQRERDLEVKATEESLASDELKNQKILELDKKFMNDVELAVEEHNEKIKQLNQEKADDAARIREEDLQKELDKLDTIQRETARFTSSINGLNRAVSDNKLAQLQAEFDKGKINDEEFERRRKEIARAEAKAAKDLALLEAIINTSVAVTKFLAKGSIPEAVAAGLFGGLEIAAISARQIPEFEKGTKSSPEGPAVVGEKGKELVFLSKDSKVVSNRSLTKYGSELDAIIDDTFDKKYREPDFGALQDTLEAKMQANFNAQAYDDYYLKKAVKNNKTIMIGNVSELAREINKGSGNKYSS